jgi:transcriptional regulator with GAF, ATPase, and Fis domain
MPCPSGAPGLLGGTALDDARACIETIADTKSAVLLLGETGTGKEVVARAIHSQSGRAGQFVALNCAAVPSELMEAELFGHSRGAFSGAASARAGLFRSADRGTLFLDEVGDLAEDVQAKLLRVLETDEIRSLGEDRTTNVDVRIVAATNRDLDELVESGKFRGDLLYRMAGLRIRLPALREHREDVPALADQFLVASDLGLRMDVLAVEQLILHRWPGNVRELKNAVLAAAAVARKRGDQEISDEHVHGVLSAVNSSRDAADREADDQEARIHAALREAKGDVGLAARALGMSRTVLYERLRRRRIDPRVFRAPR